VHENVEQTIEHEFRVRAVDSGDEGGQVGLHTREAAVDEAEREIHARDAGSGVHPLLGTLGIARGRLRAVERLEGIDGSQDRQA